MGQLAIHDSRVSWQSMIHGTTGNPRLTGQLAIHDPWDNWQSTTHGSAGDPWDNWQLYTSLYTFCTVDHFTTTTKKSIMKEMNLIR
ncbi:hypothetical protein BaRGS_00038244 [Batillaria attramentaria]|uniref:Uncharacterized protein n=1 Tax=Batillaria attramentaria TaxID=370345 RepID=A0ABD0J6G7_9CAEN